MKYFIRYFSLTFRGSQGAKFQKIALYLFAKVGIRSVFASICGRQIITCRGLVSLTTFFTQNTWLIELYFFVWITLSVEDKICFGFNLVRTDFAWRWLLKWYLRLFWFLFFLWKRGIFRANNIDLRGLIGVIRLENVNFNSGIASLNAFIA